MFRVRLQAMMADLRNTKVLIRHFNFVLTAKYIAVCLVVALVLYYGARTLKHNGCESCKCLMEDGRFVQGAWQPYGCVMHNYTKRDACTCMHYLAERTGYTSIVFLGDSRLRNLHNEFTNLFKESPSEPVFVPHSLSYRNEKIKLKAEFIWQTHVNRSMCNVFKSWAAKSPAERPGLIVFGAALWTILESSTSVEALEVYKAALKCMVPSIEKLKKSTKVIWRVQSPVEVHKLPKRKNNITNYLIDRYNEESIDILQHSVSYIWMSSRLLCQSVANKTFDGIHEVTTNLYWDSQILLNLYCNNVMSLKDGTCCIR